MCEVSNRNGVCSTARTAYAGSRPLVSEQIFETRSALSIIDSEFDWSALTWKKSDGFVM